MTQEPQPPATGRRARVLVFSPDLYNEETRCATPHFAARVSRKRLFDREVATLSEGFCPLCPEVRLQPVQTDGRWPKGIPEWVAEHRYCDCCDRFWQLKSYDDGGIGVSHTGGRRTESRDDLNPEWYS